MKDEETTQIEDGEEEKKDDDEDMGEDDEPESLEKIKVRYFSTQQMFSGRFLLAEFT